MLTTAAFVTISSTTPLLALMIGLAVGIDYALFILSRHRSQLASGMDPAESAATAVATAGSSVIFAGVTVMIALVGLLIVGIPFLGLMGVAAAIAVLLAMLAATTLLPAVMGLLGRRLAPRPFADRRRAAAGLHERDEPRRHRPSPLGQRWVGLVMKAPVVAVIAVVGVLGTVAIPAASLALALPDGGSQPTGTTARAAYDIVSREFGPGRNGPLIVTVDITQTTKVMGDLTAIGDRIAKLPGVDSVSAGTPNATLDTAIIQVIPTTGPSDPKTTKLVESIRALEPWVAAKYGTPIAVTGATAVAIDVSSRLDSALLPFGIIVVGLSVLLLTVVFRSLLVPIKAALGYLLSVLASFGVVVAVFQWGWGGEVLGAVPGPILSFMPVLLMAILFGLAMDYEVFLVSGMREAYVHGVAKLRAGASAKERNEVAKAAIVSGFSGAARVVTAAALIMFFVFGAFVPEGSAVIKVIALGLAVGVFVDAFLIRMTLVPAVMALAGRAAWYLPRWLNRLLPNVDIEGEGLRHHREATAWALDRVAAGEQISLDGLVVGAGSGAAAVTVGPVSLHVDAGSIALVDGDPTARRLVAAAVGGRLEPRAGRAQVAGHPLPSDAAKVARLVAIADLSGAGQSRRDRHARRIARGATAAHQPVVSRARLPGAVPGSAPVASRERLQGLDRQTVPVDASTPVESLPQLERAVALAAVALSERTPVVLLDALDPFSEPLDARAFLLALDRLAPAATTVVVGMPGLASRGGGHARAHPGHRKLSGHGRCPAMKKPLRLIGLVAVALVPLAFVGLYVASIGDAKNGVDRIPAAIVNQDTAITTTNADGTSNYVLAGRQLVTAAHRRRLARHGLDAEQRGRRQEGTRRWLGLCGPDDPERLLEVGALAAGQFAGAGAVVDQDRRRPLLSRGLGRAIVGRRDGAHLRQRDHQAVHLGRVRQPGHARRLAVAGGGRGDLPRLRRESDLSGRVVADLRPEELHRRRRSLSSGLAQLNSGAASLDQLSSGVASYTGGVSQLSSALTAAVAANDTAQIQSLTAQLAAVAGQGSSLSSQTTSGLAGIQSGIAQSAAGAKKLAGAGSSLVSGADALAGGAAQLSSGASSLATGLSDGAAQVPSADSAAATRSANVASDPVGLTVSTAHSISQLAQAVATFFLPLALWIGALAVFLVMRPVTRRILASTARSSRVVGATLVRAGAITGAQAAAARRAAAHRRRHQLGVPAGHAGLHLADRRGLHGLPLPADHRSRTSRAGHLVVLARRSDCGRRSGAPATVERAIPGDQSLPSPQLGGHRDAADRHRRKRGVGDRLGRCSAGLRAGKRRGRESGDPAHSAGGGAGAGACPGLGVRAGVHPFEHSASCVASWVTCRTRRHATQLAKCAGAGHRGRILPTDA